MQKLFGMNAICWAVGVVAIALPSSSFAQSTYYVSPGGSDLADGLTPATAWKSIAKVNATNFSPGSNILLQRGATFNESLTVSSSGTTSQPIVFGAYGSGSKPILSGSDRVNRSLLPLDGAGTYYANTTQPVNAFLVNEQFLPNAASQLPAGSSLDQKVAYVKSHPNSWTYQDGHLYVNTNGANPLTSTNTYSAAVRDDLIYTNYQSNLVFKDLVARDSAKEGAGYAFRVQGGANVTIQDSEAYNAGKHHFGAINTTGFLADGIYASGSMPDQGYGGASAFVAFSDSRAPDSTSVWRNAKVENTNSSYPGFYTHGEGIGSITLDNVQVIGTGLDLATDVPTAKIKVTGGKVVDGRLALIGNGIQVDGINISGKVGGIDFSGSNNLVQNSIVTGAYPYFNYKGAVVNAGIGNTLRFSTVVLDPTSNPDWAAVSLVSNDPTFTLIGNILDSGNQASSIRSWFGGVPDVNSDLNLFAANAKFFVNLNGVEQLITFAQWQQALNDFNSILGNPKFVDQASGDFRLGAGSAAIDATGINPTLWGILQDYYDQARLVGTSADIGAAEYQSITYVPEPASALVLAAAGGVAMSRRRRR